LIYIIAIIKIKLQPVFVVDGHIRKVFWFRVADKDHSNAKEFIVFGVYYYKTIELLSDIIFLKNY